MKNTPHYVWIGWKLYTHTPSVPVEDVDFIKYAPTASIFNPQDCIDECQPCCSARYSNDQDVSCAQSSVNSEFEDEKELDAFVDDLVSHILGDPKPQKSNKIDLSKLFKLLGVA